MNLLSVRTVIIMKTRLATLWNGICFAVYTAAIFYMFYYFEQPELASVQDIIGYIITRLMLSILVQVGVRIIHESHPRMIYRTILQKLDEHEFEDMMALPKDFLRLTARVLIMLDTVWAREYLLQSPLIYSRFVDVYKEINNLRHAYGNYVETYSKSLLEAFKAVDQQQAIPFIETYANHLDEFFAKVETASTNQFSWLSTRRKKILDAFFEFNAAVTKEMYKIGV